jgi:hypothetical protein
MSFATILSFNTFIPEKHGGRVQFPVSVLLGVVMTNHSYKFALMIAGAMALAAPLAITPAAAEPHHNDMGRGNGGHMGGHVDAFHDHSHMPPMRAERRPPMPHGGHYRWRAGNWGWRNGQWAWQPGIYIRF